MPYQDKHGRQCGFLDIEEKENSGHFVRRYVVINPVTQMIEYYMDNPQNLPPNSKEVGGIKLDYVSLVKEASKVRPKVKFCFYLTVAGERCYLKADSEDDKDQWINVITDACKITVPTADASSHRESSTSCGNTSYKTEIVGGVVVKTNIESNITPNCPLHTDGIDSDSSSEVLECERIAPIYKTAPIKTGYCTKQGALRRNWKRRWFVLDEDGLSYYKSSEEKKPIRTLVKAEVLDIRKSVGIHLNRDNLFEIVTSQRVFYIQTDSAEEMKSWISSIAKFIEKAEKVADVGVAETQVNLDPPIPGTFEQEC